MLRCSCNRELSDGEVATIESAIQRAFAADPHEPGIPTVDPLHAPG